jgi:succinate dehydrogenase / fumarate reductase cytochrome b subunit
VIAVELFGGDEFGENTRRSARASASPTPGLRTSMSKTLQQKRPEFKNIHVTQIASYRLPAGGVASFLHRFSGALMFLALPLLLWLFDLSLTSELSYARLAEVFSIGFVKLVLLGLSWALLHHLVTGIRHLLLDLHIGIEKDAAARSALWVYLISLPLTVLAALKLFGVM